MTFDTFATFEAAGTLSPGWNHVVAAGDDRLLLVCFCGESGNNVDWEMSAVTAGGAACTQLITPSPMNGSGFGASMWYRIAPGTGTIAIAGTCSQQLFGDMGSQSWQGVHQTTPLGTPNSLVATGASPSLLVAANTGDVVVAAGGWLNTTLSHSHTQRYKLETDIFHRTVAVSQDASGNVTISFTLGGSVIHYYIGVALKASGGPASRILMPNKLRPAIFRPGIAR